jgi:hypothetical protein
MTDAELRAEAQQAWYAERVQGAGMGLTLDEARRILLPSHDDFIAGYLAGAKSREAELAEAVRKGEQLANAYGGALVELAEAVRLLQAVWRPPHEAWRTRRSAFLARHRETEHG